MGAYRSADGETPEQAAHRIYSRLQREGFHLAKIFPYLDELGSPLWWLLRWECDGKRKEPRPLCLIDGKFSPTQPPPGPHGKALFGLNRMAWNPGEPIWIVEGEKAADCLYDECGEIGMSWPGGAQSIHLADWGPLAGRTVVLWPDNDESGILAVRSVLPLLRNQGTVCACVDVSRLGLRRHGDVVDWLDQLWQQLPRLDPGDTDAWLLRQALAFDALPMVADV